MAISFIGQKCSVCGNVIEHAGQIFSFPAFVQNTKDPFYAFNDATFHLACLDRHPLGNQAIQFADEFILKTRPESRICAVGGNVIQHSDDYLFIDLLTSNSEESLFKYNFLTLDRNNLRKWVGRNDFISVATKFEDEGKWGDLTSYRYLRHLIDRISKGSD